MTPKLLEAAKLIGYDNGCINREQPEDAWLAGCEDRLKRLCTPMQLNETEHFLVSLTPEQLVDVCCGDQYINIPLYADHVLSRIFEEPS